jgi:hypothetical protein
MPPTRFFARVLLTATLASPLLWGDDYQFLGAQVGLGKPVGALADWSGGHPGYTLGLQQLIDEGEGVLFRTHLDYFAGVSGHTDQLLQGPSGPVQAGLENKFSVFSIGLDSLYYVQGDIKSGLYVFGGIGGASTHLVSQCDGDATGGAGNWPASGTLATTSNKFFWSAGLGWQYDAHLGAEVRYLISRWSYQDIAIQDAFVTIAVTFRFPCE